MVLQVVKGPCLNFFLFYFIFLEPLILGKLQSIHSKTVITADKCFYPSLWEKYFREKFFFCQVESIFLLPSDYFCIFLTFSFQIPGFKMFKKKKTTKKKKRKSRLPFVNLKSFSALVSFQILKEQQREKRTLKLKKYVEQNRTASSTDHQIIIHISICFA